MSGRRVAEGLAFLLLAVTFVGTLVWTEANARVAFSSDQAVPALMAQHIADGKGHPVFYWGSTYGGSFEPHVLAAVFLVAGPSVGAYRATMACLLFFVAAGVVVLTWRAFGNAAALVTAACLALPPFYFVFKGLQSDGAYNAVNLSAIGTLASALAIDRALSRGGRAIAPALVFGLAVGFGIWITPVCLPVGAGAALWIALRRAPRPGPVALASAATGLLVGAAPSLIWNARHGWASARAGEMGLLTLPDLGPRALALLRDAVPVLVGAAPPYVPVRFSEGFPLASIVMPLVLLALLMPAIASAVGGDRTRQLFVVSSAALAGAALVSARFVPHEPRYLYALYVLLPPLVGSSTAWFLARPGRKVLLGVLVCLLAAGDAAGFRSAPRKDVDDGDPEVAPSVTRLARTLDEHGLRRVYANYWTAYRIGFETGGRIVGSPPPADDIVRVEEYRREVDAEPDPAVVLLRPEADCFSSYLRERGATFETLKVDRFVIFNRLPGEIRDGIRATGTIPLPLRAYDVTWLEVHAPSSLRAGERSIVRVRFRNSSGCTWKSSIHLGSRWRALDGGGEPIEGAARANPVWRAAPGETLSASLAIEAPSRPGRYRLELDLVHENVAWFSSKGARVASVEVGVR